MKVLRGLLIISLILALLPARALAQVGAMVKVKQPLQMPPTVEMSGRDLRDQYSLFSVADAVRYYSGILFKDYAGLGGLSTINVRSLGSERMGIFYNGLEIGNTLNGNVDLSRFSLENVSNLSIFSGQKADIFQCARDFASSNSMYITSRRPTFARPDQNSNFRAQVRGATNMALNPSFLYEQDFGNYVYSSFNVEMLTATNPYRFKYQRQNAEGALVYDTVARRQNNDVNAFRGEFALHGLVSTEAIQSGTWNFFAYHYSTDRGLPGAIVNNVWYMGERLTERNTFLQGSARLDVNSWYRTQLMLKLASDFTHYTNNDDKLAKVDESYLQYTGYLSSSHLFSILPGWKASLAYDIEFNHMSKKDVLLNRRAEGFSTPFRFVNMLSIATQYQIEQFSVQGSVLGTYVINQAMKGFTAPEDEKGISPALNLYYMPVKDFTLKAYVKQTYRVPNYNDRYISSLIGETLKPELATQYNFGLGYNHTVGLLVDRFGINVEGYYNQVKNKIIAFPRSRVYKWAMMNLGVVDIFGADANAFITMKTDAQINFTLRGQYTYQQALDVTNKNDTYYRHQIPNVPQHSGSAVFQLAWDDRTKPDKVAFNASFLYVGKRFSEQENIKYNELQPYYSLDLALSWRHKFGEWKFTTMFEVNNVLGDAGEIVTNYPMPGQIYKITLTTELN